METEQIAAENHLLNVINSLSSAFQEYANRTDNQITCIASKLQEQTSKQDNKHSATENTTVQQSKFLETLMASNKYEAGYISGRISKARRLLKNKRENIRKLKNRIVELNSKLRMEIEEEMQLKTTLNVLKEKEDVESGEDEMVLNLR